MSLYSKPQPHSLHTLQAAVTQGGRTPRSSFSVKRSLRLLFTLALLMLALAGAQQTASAQINTVDYIYAVTTTNQLVTFYANRPGLITTTVQIIGLQPGEVILGLDLRPADQNVIYGLGSTARIYMIFPETGVALPVNNTPLPLNGSEFGFDFNPSVDRIRIVNDNDQNFRINPTNGTVAGMDTPLAYATGDPNFGQNPTIVGAAYTNNFPGATPTTLYDIDSDRDILVRQGSVGGNPTSPNTGQLFTIGSLGVNTTPLVGFDIAQTSGAVYASLTSVTTGVSSLYTIDLATGAATLVGAIGSNLQIRDITVDIPPPPFIFGLTNGNTIVVFSAAAPGTILDTLTVTGLQPNELLLAMDFRPANGQLYALGSGNNLYLIDQGSGAATRINTASLGLNGGSFGFDFNPTVDRIRITNDNDQNFRVNPDNGVVTIDAPLAYAGGDVNAGKNPNIVGSAYTNNIPGATSTTLYDIDSNLDILTTQNPPNNGTLNTVGSLGVDTTSLVGFDIAAGTNTAYAQLTEGSGQPALYYINLSTGAGTRIGTIGTGAPLFDIAVLYPAPRLVYGLTTSNRLVTFTDLAPGTILSDMPITGLQPGEIILAIDARPANGMIYGLGSTARLYTIDPAMGIASPVSPTPLPLNGSEFGFDFNPTVDRIRIVNDNDQNIRVNPDTAVPTVDAMLAYMAGDPNFGQNPTVVGAAYTNNGGSATTALYDIDSDRDALVIQSPPNNGTLITIGSLGLNTSALVGFDVAPLRFAFTDFAPGGNAFAALTPLFTGVTSFYRINLATGTATLVGPIGSNLQLRGMAFSF